MLEKILKSNKFLFSAILLGILIKIFQDEINSIPLISYYSEQLPLLKNILRAAPIMFIAIPITIFGEKSSKRRKWFQFQIFCNVIYIGTHNRNK